MVREVVLTCPNRLRPASSRGGNGGREGNGQYPDISRLCKDQATSGIHGKDVNVLARLQQSHARIEKSAASAELKPADASPTETCELRAVALNDMPTASFPEPAGSANSSSLWERWREPNSTEEG